MLATVAYALSVTVLFNVNTIEITGSSRYDKQMIIDMSGIESGDNLIRLDTADVSDRICRGLPYIGVAKVERKLPDNVRITVEECEPDCVFEQDGEYLIASGTKCLERTADLPDGLITVKAKLTQYSIGDRIKMEDRAEEALDGVLELAKTVGIEDITQINVENASDISFVCSNRIRLKIGTTESLDKKMNNAVSIIAAQKEKYGENVEGTVDLRYLSDDANRSYFTRESIASQPEAAKAPPAESNASQVSSGNSSAVVSKSQ